MTNAFDYKNKASKIDWQAMNRDANRSKSVTKVVERQRAKGIEPMKIGLNKNAHLLTRHHHDGRTKKPAHTAGADIPGPADSRGPDHLAGDQPTL